MIDLYIDTRLYMLIGEDNQIGGGYEAIKNNVSWVGKIDWELQSSHL